MNNSSIYNAAGSRKNSKDFVHDINLEIFHYHITFILSAPWVLAELSLGVNKGTIEVLTSCHQKEEGCCTTCSIPLPRRTACCTAPDPRQPATMQCTP